MRTSVNPPSRLRLVINEANLCAWLADELVGAVLQYHRGFLARDIDPHSGRMFERDRAELRRVALRARCAAKHGLAHLVQRRHGTDDYSYQLIMRPRRKVAPASPSGMPFDSATKNEAIAVADADEVEA